MVKKSKYIWLDGKLVPWDDANVHILTHTLHYGLGAFEGIRCYKRDDGRSTIFRLREHIRRLVDSCKIVQLQVPWSIEQICEACVDTVAKNGLEACYLRPLVFVGDGAMGLGSVPDNPVRLAIVTWPWGSYLGEEGLQNGIRVKVSSYTRPSVNSAMVRGKIVGQYTVSILAKREAIDSGYHEAILLDDVGLVAEGSGENIFIARDGLVWTTPLSGSLLEGITRDTVIKILDELGIEVRRESFTRDTLYIADEAFFTELRPRSHRCARSTIGPLPTANPARSPAPSRSGSSKSCKAATSVNTRAG